MSSPTAHQNIQGVPSTVAPVVDAAGIVTPPWYQFFVSLFRTLNISGLLAQVNQYPAISNVAPGASPITYTAATSGTMFVSGGLAVNMTVSRNAGTSFPTGAASGPIPLAAGDTLVISYGLPPILSWAPKL